MSDRSPQKPNDDLPDWLKELRERQDQASSDSTSKIEGEEIQEGKSLRRLSDTQPLPRGGKLAKRQIGQPDDEEETEESEKVESAPHSHVPAFDTGGDENIKPGELPAWLRAFRPGAEELGTSGVEVSPEGEETLGPLAGLSGVLPAEPSVLEIGKVPAATTILDVTERQRRHAQNLEKLVASEYQSTREEQNHAERMPRAQNLVMAALLITAIFVPLVTQGQNVNRPELDALPEAASMFAIIEELRPGSPVLVVLDAEPAFFGEIQPAANSILNHLFERQARLTFLSTRPTGPALADELLDTTTSANQLVEGADYFNLGYLSGGMAAIRSFSSNPQTAPLSAFAAPSNPWTNETLRHISSIGDFPLIIIVGGDADDVRSWIEQTSGAIHEGLLAVVSAQAGPLLRPFMHSNPVPLRGIVVGTQGAAYYEKLRGQEPVGNGWDSYSYGLGAITILILFGNLSSRLMQLRRGKTTPLEDPP